MNNIDDEIERKERNDEDLQWVKQRLQKDCEQIKLPDSLKSKNLMYKLDGIIPDAPKKSEAAPAAKKAKVIWLRYLSAAACVALIFFGWRQMGKNDGAAMGMVAAAPMAASPAESQKAAAAADTTAGVTAASAAAKAADAEPEAAPELVIPQQPVAKSYAEVYNALNTIAANNVSDDKRMYAAPSAMANGAMMMDGAASAEAVTNPAIGMASDDAEVYTTNVQIEGVDEADIVKTDGVYIYHYRFDKQTGGAQVAITAANGLKLLSTIALPDYSDAEMYISGDRLIIVEQLDREKAEELTSLADETMADYVGADAAKSKASSEGGVALEVVVPEYYPQRYRNRNVNITEAVIYDISDHKAPKELTRYRQDGSYVSSRLTNGMLYLVSNKRTYNDIRLTEPARYYMPIAGENDSLSVLPADDIIIPPYLNDLNYAVVTSLDISVGTADTKAVLGMADKIMMSRNSLFLTANVYGGARMYSNRQTGITRLAVTKDGLKYLASGKVDGYIESQFSLDEYNGNLRIATTSYTDDRETVNNVFVLDGELKQIGSVTGLAEGERIYSVRYMGDTAYVVTFRETDPLFVVDLSDPKKPVVKGQLKIPGFSEYLHPVDENTLIGLGNNTTVTKYGGVVTDGLKLSLFDVTDPTAPVEKASYLLGNMGSTSEALENHKAFMYYDEMKLMGFPASIYTVYGASTNDPWSGERRLSFDGFLLISVKPSGFEVVASIPSGGQGTAAGFMRTDTGDAIDRGFYIGKTLYTASSAKLMAFSLDSFEQIGELKY